MRINLKNYLFPHPGNDHKPHLLREASVIVLTLIIVLLFGFSIFHAILIEQNADFTAAVLPGVLVDLANEDRESNGLGELSINPVLEEAAQMKAQNMAELGYFAHVSPEGLDPWYWFYRAGYDFANAGENLAVNFIDSQDVEKAWMNSPGHRANILNGKFTEIGIAAAKGTYKGKKTLFVVQLFGTPTFQARTVTQPIARTVATTNTQLTPQIVQREIPAGIVAGQQTTKKASTSSSTVLGAEIEKGNDIPASDMYVELPQASQGETHTESPNQNTHQPQISEKENTNAWEQFLAHPRAAVEWGYILIGLLIAVVLILMIFIEIHKQHPRNIFYGVALLVLIFLLSYLNFLLLSADILVV